MAAAPPTKLYKVGKTIRYGNPAHPLFNQIVKPGLTKPAILASFPGVDVKKLSFDKQGTLRLPFPHLSENSIKMLTRTRTLILSL